MITSEAAGLALSIAKGLFKLTKRVDLVLAEKAAVQSTLPTIQPSMILRPNIIDMALALRTLLKETPTGTSDPLVADRTAIDTAVKDTIDRGAQNSDILIGFMRKHLPKEAIGETLDLNGEVLTAIKKRRPDWDLSDTDVRIAAFSIAPGEDSRQKGYTWRLALTVVDVVAEFGAENIGLFTRDKKVQGIAKAVLQRFADADLQKLDSNSDLLKAVLSATLNGALDAKDHLGVDNKWLGGLLNALHTARESLPEGKRKEFLLGLFAGRGYPRLVGAVLKEAATRLGDEDAGVLEKVAADVLGEAGKQLMNKTQFGGFLKEHWGDLLRAGLGSLAKHGNILLKGASPLVQTVVKGMLTELSKTPNHKFLTGDMLVGMVDAAADAVAANPKVLEGTNPPWLQELVRSVISTVAADGIRKTFSKQGLEKTVKNVLTSFAKNPELIIKSPGLARELVRGVLTNLSTLDRFSAESMANAALTGSLGVLAKNPELVGTGYPALVASLAKRLGELVQNKSITGFQGSDLLRVVSESVAENIQLFVDKGKLADSIVNAVLDASKGDPKKLLAGATLVDVVRQITVAIGRNGQTAIDKHGLNKIKDGLVEVLKAALKSARDRLGKGLGVPALPDVLGGLVTAWARGEIEKVNPNDSKFKALFEQLAEKAAA